MVPTHSTTYDLDDYYADLKRMPRLSDEERLSLLRQTTSEPDGNTPATGLQAKHQIIESYLSFAVSVAIEQCSPEHYTFLPDLIGEANLELVKAIMCRDLSGVTDLTSYLGVSIRGRLKGAIAGDCLIALPRGVRDRARQRGTLDQLYDLQPVSLDHEMQRFERERGERGDQAREPLVRPITSTGQAPEPAPAQRVLVEEYLSYLSPRAQTILRLRYGLLDGNEHAHTTAEMVRLLGMKRKSVLAIERDAKRRLRALAAGQATIAIRRGRGGSGKPCISLPMEMRRTQRTTHQSSMKPPTLTPEQEAALAQACERLREQGLRVSGRSLAQATGISKQHAWAFLQARRAEQGEIVWQAIPQEERARQRQARLEEAYRRLEAENTLSVHRLWRTARVGWSAAAAFLRERQAARQEGQATQTEGKGQASHADYSRLQNRT